ETTPTDYSFQVNFLAHTSPTAITGAALTLGTVYDDSSNPIGASGEVDYQFTLTASTRLLFDSQTNDNSLTWQLTGPQGLIATPSDGVNPTPFSDDDQQLGALSTGTYSLKIFGPSAMAYAFQMLS